MRNHYTRPSVSFDLDETLTVNNAWPEIGHPNHDVIALARDLHRRGWWVVLHTSRPNAYAEPVQDWCLRHDVPVDQLVFGRPNVDVQIDDKGLLPPVHALEALIYRRACDRYGDGWLDALVQGELPSDWADEQRQVPEADGRPDQPDDFTVVLPLSGGLDSTTLWAMAYESGLPVLPVYVSMGQEYEAAELEAVEAITDQAPVMVDGPTPPDRWSHLLPGRNAAIIDAAAQEARKRGLWGELWVGNLAGESPVVGGDKSRRFLATCQHLLTLDGHDLRLCSPLASMDKTDLVRWWLARPDGEPILLTVKSCFHPNLRRCGHCQTCFRFLVALEAAGVDTQDGPWWPHGEAWAEHAAKYEPAMTAAMATADWSAYSPVRCRDTLTVIARLRSQGRLGD